MIGWSHHRPCNGKWPLFLHKQVTVLEPNPTPWGVTMCPTRKELWFQNKHKPTNPEHLYYWGPKPLWCWTFSLWNEDGRTIGRGSKGFQSAVVKWVDAPRAVEEKGRTVPLWGVWADPQQCGRWDRALEEIRPTSIKGWKQQLGHCLWQPTLQKRRKMRNSKKK